MTHDDLVKLAGRVQRLERDNRRLKLGAGALVAVLVGVPLVAAALPAQVPEVIEARSFRVLDEQGTQRARLSELGLGFFDEQETLRSVFRAESLGFLDEQENQRSGFSGGGLSFFDEQENQRSVFGEMGLTFYDEQEAIRAALFADLLAFFDEQGKRLQLGRVTVLTERTEAETTYPAFDEDGNVIARLPR